MAGPSKKLHMSDEVLYELLQKNEDNDISEGKYSSHSEVNMKILSYGEHSVNSDDNSNIQHGVWAASGAEGPPGINVDPTGHSNPLEYFYFLCAPEIAEIIAREIIVSKHF
jgi:hypothetical protein